MTTIKELREIIKNLPDDMEVIAVGYNEYGQDLGSPTIETMVYDDTDYSKKSQPKKVLAFQIDSYLFENEDIGYSEMWMNEQDYNEACEFHDENSEDDEDDNKE